MQLIDAVRLLESILLCIPDRPTGESMYAPGKHGETYCISQESLWHRGGVWIVLAANTLQHYLEKWYNQHV